MALIIGFGSQKGGPGKSTLCRGVAVGYALNDWSVKIADLDLEQSTVVHWLRDRLKNDISPTVSAEVYGSVTQALKRAEAFDAVLFDGAPHASRQTVEVAQACDLFVIPTGLALDDLRPAVVLADTLTSKHGIPVDKICLALNHVGDSTLEIDDALAYIAHTPFHVLDGYLPHKTGIRRTQDRGLSIIETPYPSVRQAAEKLVQAVIDRAAQLTN